MTVLRRSARVYVENAADISGGGGGGGAVTVADGADVAQGATTDAATVNSVIGRLKKLISLLPTALGSSTSANSLPVVVASDQVAVASKVADGVNVTLGALADAAVGDASGSVNAHLRQIAKTITSGGPATVADGADVTLGAIADAAVSSDATGTANAHLRGIVKLLAAGINVATTAEVPGVASTSLGKAEDAAHTSGDTGVYTMGTRQDTPAATAGTSGDYQGAAYDTTGRAYADTALDGSALMNNGAALTPKFAKITASASGATTIVALVSAKKIRVLAWDLVCNGAVNVKWQSHVIPTDETGLYYFAANGGISRGFNPLGYFETIAGEALDINLSGAVAVGGVLTYVEV